MATHTHTPPGTRRGGTATGCAPAALVLNITNRSAVQAGIRHLVAILDVMDMRPQFAVTAAGQQVLEAAR